MNIGYFISSHGFGHASRACAVMDTLGNMAYIKFYIFTATPEWFFRNSLSVPFELIRIQSDVGLVQATPFEEDIEKTIISLEEFLPFSDLQNEPITQLVSQKKLDLILCDISPIGLWVAERLDIPSVLIENFTWDWIYEHYLESYPGLEKFISIFREIYESPTIHFTCEPFCKLSEKSIIVPPVFRVSRTEKEKIRKQLGVREGEKLILVTMGGIPIEYVEENRWLYLDDYKILMPVNDVRNIQKTNNIIYLPHDHPFFHPDLVNASDLVIGKLGYSTVAEVYSLDKPFLFIGRRNFRESKILKKFVLEHLISEEVELATIFSSQTIDKSINLISKTRIKTAHKNGADEIAHFVLKYFG